MISYYDNRVRLNELSTSKLPSELSGIYCIKHEENISYPKGKSDILYIGQTDNYCRRIFGNYIGGIGGAMTQRIHEMLFNESYIEKVSFKNCDDYKDEEKRLRKIFLRIHSSLPTWNKV